MADLIERQAAIDALRVAYWDKNIQSAKGDPCIVDAMTDWAIRQIKALPSTQPEVRTQMSSADCISRQAAIDAVKLGLSVESIREVIAGLPIIDTDRYEYGEYDALDLLSSEWYGKRYYFMEKNGLIYSMGSRQHMTLDDALDEFAIVLGEMEVEE